MEEIDNIIIESLKHLNCNLDEEITSLKQFDENSTTSAISTCLEAIIPDTKFQKKLPPSMSTKLKIASDLAQQIKKIGFRGDMGYQTILYCNDSEIRKVLMFLIEKLPRESSKVAQMGEIGYVPTLIKEIEGKVKLSLKQMWLPSSVFNKGAKLSSGSILMQNFSESCALQSEKLEIPNTSNPESEALKQYYIHIVEDVTKQCPPNKLIPSLLFRDNIINFDIAKTDWKSVFNAQKSVEMQPSIDLIHDQIELSPVVAEKTVQNVDKIQNLIKEIEEHKANYVTLQDEIKNCRLKLSQIEKMKSEEEQVLDNVQFRIKIKSKTLAVLSKEENLMKLRNLVENGSERLIELTNQWNQVQTPLLEQYKSLKSSLTSEEIKFQQEQDKIKNLKDAYKNLELDLKEKEQLERHLKQKCEQINKNNNRSGYTRRILEIIGNIKKQNDEIQKVLKDTKLIQKEINQLTGQVDRSFTLSDELIFRDAKQDEAARKAYKLLASLRDECSDIIKGVTDLGLAERESRNLQEQVDMEKIKETASKLERVNKDLEEIRRETAILLQKN